MHIEFIEIANFRKLHCTRVSLAIDKTVFVGANNSGKTSAMLALRYFLIKREQSRFSLNDFTLSHWQAIDKLGQTWEAAKAKAEALPEADFGNTLPFLDVWINAELSELQYVKNILPSLEWAGGRLGVRLRFEPKDPRQLQVDYLSARVDAQTIQGGEGAGVVNIWPDSLTKFLERRLSSYFEVKAYKLDPAKCVEPTHGFAAPQPLPDSAALDFDPFKGLVLIHEISAQRGFGQAGPLDALDNDDDSRLGPASATRKLSEQLRQYYSRHLNPYAKPDAQDLTALKAIEEAQKAFDQRLKEGFAAALSEMEKLGYPGVTDPQLLISTRLRPVDGLNHEAAVQYVIRGGAGETVYEMRLPEDSNGLGYQNLISMVFRLMSFRDAWVRVGKAKSKTETTESIIAPLHVVLIEEPEAHLHTQVQQVFIRQAYRILRNHALLGADKTLTTQMVVSTHSSHIAHECDYGALRYFRRMPAKDGEIPTSRVVNLTNVFGTDTETKRFVTRYLKVTHCDLLFADAAVLIEGPAERILAPHFVQHQTEFEALNEAYITWLEISGSHAHRLRELVEHLGLTTLIVTDLDATDADGKSVRPQKGAGQKTRNATLKGWCPAIESLDELLAAQDEAKIKNYEKQQFSIRVAYQCPAEVTFKGKKAEALAYKRIVVAIDPSASTEEDSNECGIVSAGLGINDHGYVLDDVSGVMAPNDWALKAIALMHERQADRIIAETNNGGDMVEATLRMIDRNVSYRSVWAARGKVTRAEPVSALYEQGRVHHVGPFPRLEDQMCAFTIDFNRRDMGYSPDRVDALVWALTELMIEGPAERRLLIA